VLPRDPAGQFEPHALRSADPSVPSARIIAWLVEIPHALFDRLTDLLASAA
jgi:hypothetical protein